nr:hypothetical protein [Tanacetum cinerariifolium]
MVNTRTDADLSAAVQNALQALLPQIHEEIPEEFRTGSGSSNVGGNPPPNALQALHPWIREEIHEEFRSSCNASFDWLDSSGQLLAPRKSRRRTF